MNHKRYLLITVSFILFLGGILVAVKDNYTVTSFFPMLFFGGCLLVFLFEDNINQYIEKKNEAKLKARFCQFKKDCILFPKGYYFKHGYLKDRNELSYEHINEIRINTIPISAKINDNEIIFLVGAQKSDCIEIAQQKNIPVTKPSDNWALICDEFLDVEEPDDFRQNIIESLKEVGISEEETQQIRKEIAWRMIVHTFVSMEWIYYGQYDLLHQLTPMTETKYWWTMEIALRGK